MSESLSPVRRRRRTARGILAVLGGGAIGVLFGAAPAFAATTCDGNLGTLTVTFDGTDTTVELRKLEGSVGTAPTTFVWAPLTGGFVACTATTADPITQISVVGSGGTDHFRLEMGTAAVGQAGNSAYVSDYNYQGIQVNVDLNAGAIDMFDLQGTGGADSFTLVDTGVTDINGPSISGGAVTLVDTEYVHLSGDYWFNPPQCTAPGGNDTINASGVTAAALFDGLTSFIGCGGDDTITGTPFADNIIGNLGSDTINSGLGNDNVWPGMGDDRVNAGDGVDTVRWDNSNVDLNATGPGRTWFGPSDPVTAGVAHSLNLPNLTIQVTGIGSKVIDDFENITGSPFGDNFQGEGGPNIILGLGGNDVIEGLPGDDTLDGGTGTDWLSFINGTTGAAPLGCIADLNVGTPQWTRCADTDIIVLDGAGDSSFENLEGSSLNDTLSGDETGNVIRGRAGDDSMTGRGGTDTLDYTDTTTNCTINMSILVQQSTGCSGADTFNDLFENITTAGGSDTVTGNALGNVIITAGGNDVIFGLGGMDTIVAGAGDDTIDGGLDSDTITGGDGIDRVMYDTAGAPVTANLGPVGDCGAVAMGSTGGNGDDTYVDLIENITGSIFADLLCGNLLNNDIVGLAGDDLLFGGTTTLATSGNDTIHGDDGADQIFGRDGRDLLLGGAGADDIEGNDGDDTIDGQAGSDDLFGGNDNDLFFFVLATDGTASANLDTYNGGNHVDTLCANTDCGASATDTAGIFADLISQTLNAYAGALREMENVHAGDGDDDLLGDANNNILNSGDLGADTLFGRGGDDSLNAGAGEDEAFGGSGSDSILGGDGDDAILSGDDGNDFVSAGAGNDHVAGGTGDDVLRGGDGTEDLVDFGFEGDDNGVHANLTLGLATGNISGVDSLDGLEDIRGTLGPDVLRGDALSNWIRGLRGNDRIDGLAGDDILDGNAGADNVRGGGGNDTMYGAAGNDLMNGGTGSDSLIGGTGRDTFRVRDGEADTVRGRRGWDTAYVDALDDVEGVEEVI